ncbi:MAG: hypothetical protein AB7I19_18245 [Planctomycetota bacterium]
MTKIQVTALATLLLLLTSCGSNAGPNGTYKLDGEAFVLGMLGITDASKATEEQKAQLEMAKTIEGTLECKADQTFSLSMKMPMIGEQKMGGTWKAEGDKLSLTGKAADSDKEETKTATWTADKITIEDKGPGGQTMKMVFKKA